MRTVGKIIDRVLTAKFGGHTGKRAAPTSMTLQLFGGFIPASR